MAIAYVPLSLVWFVVIAGVFSLLAVVLSAYLIVRHLQYYTQSNHQRYIVRILFMVPTYAIYSLLCLIFARYSVYLALIRDSYEAYVIYMFFALCINYGGGYDNLVQKLMAQPPFYLAGPFCMWKVQPGGRLLRLCRQGVLQYVLVKPTMAVLAAILESFGLYSDGDFHTNRGYLYITIVNNVSITISLYMLVVLYQAAIEELTPYKPLLKFLCIKFVVFFSFWQGVALAIAGALGWIPRVDNWDDKDMAVAIQNFLICVEMFIVSILHMKAFPYDLYQVNVMSKAPLIHEVEMGTWLKSVRDSTNQRDVIADTVDSFVPEQLRTGKSKSSVNYDTERPVNRRASQRMERGGLLANAAPEAVVEVPAPKEKHENLETAVKAEDDPLARNTRR